ncbi:MAG: hypothetical protein IJ309_01460 [Clostridia bacterium]|nr:hypothetical protein [Clostridia bacterium]
MKNDYIVSGFYEYNKGFFRKRFSSLDEAKKCLHKLLVKCAKALHINDLLDKEEKTATRYTKELIDFLRAFFNEKTDPSTLRCPFYDYYALEYDDIYDEDEDVYYDPVDEWFSQRSPIIVRSGYDDIDCIMLGKKLRIDGLWSLWEWKLEEDDSCEMLFSLNGKTVLSVSFCTEDKKELYRASSAVKSIPAANSLLVFEALSSEGQSLLQIREKIKQNHFCSISTKRISDQLKVIASLGFDVQKRYFLDIEDNELVITPRANFYITNKEEIPAPVKGAKLTPNAYVLLVFLTLKASTVPLKQGTISEILRENYQLTINRATVGRHLKLIANLGYKVVKTAKGYALAN